MYLKQLSPRGTYHNVSTWTRLKLKSCFKHRNHWDMRCIPSERSRPTNHSTVAHIFTLSGQWSCPDKQPLNWRSDTLHDSRNRGAGTRQSLDHEASATSWILSTTLWYDQQSGKKQSRSLFCPFTPGLFYNPMGSFHYSSFVEFTLCSHKFCRFVQLFEHTIWFHVKSEDRSTQIYILALISRNKRLHSPHLAC